MAYDPFDRDEVEEALNDLYGPGEWQNDDFDYAMDKYNREFHSNSDSDFNDE